MTGPSEAYGKPLPVADPVTRPYWESVKAHAMRVQCCEACGTHVFYPRPVCPACFSASLTWVPVSGRGTLYSFTVVHHAPPEFRSEGQYVVALVELEEGVRLLSTLVEVAPDPASGEIQMGMPLELVYDDVTPEVTLPRFRPAR